MRYQCDQCAVSYRHKIDINNHVKAITQGNSASKCEICFITSNRKDKIRLHKSNIHGIGISNRFNCDKCDKSFARSTELRDHKLTKHEGISFKCELCEKVFSNYSTLKSHLDNYHYHENEKQVICSECNKGFSSKGYLKKHKEIVHEKRKEKHQCEICKRVFSFKENMKRHKKAVHDELKLYKCNDCDHRSKSSCDLKKHQTYIHNNTL